MDYSSKPVKEEPRAWICEACGHVYTQEEVNRLEWYDGHRCDQEVDEDNVLCGGIVLWKPVKED